MKSIPLYIHIPFCFSKCSYCDFFSVAFGQKKIPDSYLTAIINEAKFFAKKYKIAFWKTIYVGGGTPSLLSAFQIDFLFSEIKKIACIEKNAEFTFEANPCDISHELLVALGNAGVNRISVGLQSLNEKTLEAVSRRSNVSDIENAFSILHSWKKNISFDVIAGLPYETIESFSRGLKKILSQKVNHISLYSLSLEKNTPLWKSIAEKKIHYDEELANDLWMRGREKLLASGFEQYEISNFAKCGFESKHNLCYWNLESYLGLGAGAVSSFYSESENVRKTNINDVTMYSNVWNEIRKTDFENENACENFLRNEKIAKTFSLEKLDKKTLAFEFFMMGLRKKEGVCMSVYNERFGKIEKRMNEIFLRWVKAERAMFYKKNNLEFFTLTEKARMFLNSFLKELL